MKQCLLRQEENHEVLMSQKPREELVEQGKSDFTRQGLRTDCQTKVCNTELFDNTAKNIYV